MSNLISYQNELRLSVAEFRSVLVRSTLAERRPIDDLERLTAMLENADVLMTARTETDLLVGISRALTDYSYCTYLSDLAVDQAFQRHGIGKELIRQTHLTCGLRTRLILLSAPKAATYYPHVGFEQHPSCWTIPPTV